MQFQYNKNAASLVKNGLAAGKYEICRKKAAIGSSTLFYFLFIRAVPGLLVLFLGEDLLHLLEGFGLLAGGVLQVEGGEGSSTLFLDRPAPLVSERGSRRKYGCAATQGKQLTHE